MSDSPRRLDDVRFGVEWVRWLQAETQAASRRPEAAHRIAELDIPVLVLHGRHDMTFPVSLVDPAFGLIPRSA